MFANKTIKMKSPFQNEKKGLFHIPDGRVIRSKKGFTLIEVVVTLVIVGILATLGGMGIVQAVKGYVTVKQNSATTQNAQMAMSRITREIIEMSQISAAATNTSLPISNVSQSDVGGNVIGNRTIGFDSASNAVKIALGSNTLSSGDILIDNVSSLTFTYYQGSNASATWSTGNDALLSAVGVNMTLINPNISFYTLVAPRNNGNLGGVVPPSAGFPPAAGWGCFVATAAYGDPAHPMVQILRDFRDKYLLSSGAGQWFVKQYYKHGPAAADMIRNRPLAMWAVRCLLAPFAALAFCLIYAPLAIPFIFFVSLIITSAFFSAMRKGFPGRFILFHSRGSILIGLIITMVIMAILAAAMLPMFSSSYMNQVYADQGRKAYYLAESGLRYAASQYNSAASDTTLTNINNQTFTLSDNVSSFKISIYPMWFNTAASTAASVTSLTTYVAGNVPVEFNRADKTGYIYITNAGYYYYSNFSASPPNVTFSGLAANAPTTASLPALAANVVVLPVAKTTGSQTLVPGGNSSLTLNSTGANALPRLNGNFTLVKPSGSQVKSGVIFNYKTRTGATINNITIADVVKNTNWTINESIPDNTNVVLSKFLHLESTGNIGYASRTVRYSVPIGSLYGGDFQKKEYYDPMASNTNWFTGANAVGTQAFGVSAGGDAANAMRVTSVVDPSGGGFIGWLAGLFGWGTSSVWNVIPWNWANTDVNLAQAWVDAGGFLNYDIQVKVKNSDPYYFAGMMFRARANGANDVDTFGVSLVKDRMYGQTAACSGACRPPAALSGSCKCSTWSLGDTTKVCGAIFLLPGTKPCGDQIPQGVEPDALNNHSSCPTTAEINSDSSYEDWNIWTCWKYGNPGIVLWKRTGGTFTWLAYREISTDDIITETTVGGYYRYRLKDFSTLLVRVSEGNSLTFTGGGGTSGGQIKEGDVITNSDSSKSARVVMTPILTAGAWAGNNASGTLVLANISPDNGTNNFVSGDSLYVKGMQLATAGTYTATKNNYIRVYFSGKDNGSGGSGDTDEKNNSRMANSIGSHNWPPDPLSDLNSSNDYFQLVQWTNYNGISAMTSISEPNAIIVTSYLVSPPWTPTSNVSNFTYNGYTGEGIALVTAGNTGTDTYYDDFAAQADIKVGTGFMMPIQE